MALSGWSLDYAFVPYGSLGNTQRFYFSLDSRLFSCSVVLSQYKYCHSMI